VQRQFGGAVRAVERQPLEGLARARDNIVPAGRGKTARRGSTDAAKPDDGD
jgi:hypothetical protein